MPTSDAKDKISLTDRVHALSPELFNRVLHYFLEVDETTEVKVDRTYKPPVQLQLCRSIRQEYADKYYKKPFNFNALGYGDDFRKWSKSASQEHLQHVKLTNGAYYWPDPLVWQQLKDMQDALNRHKSD